MGRAGCAAPSPAASCMRQTPSRSLRKRSNPTAPLFTHATSAINRRHAFPQPNGSATLEDVRLARTADAARARARLRELLGAALACPGCRPANAPGAPEGAAPRGPCACTAALAAAAPGVKRLLVLLAVWNPLEHARLMAAELQGGRPAAGAGDARLAHWERCVRGAGLTRAQVGQSGP